MFLFAAAAAAATFQAGDLPGRTLLYQGCTLNASSKNILFSGPVCVKKGTIQNVKGFGWVAAVYVRVFKGFGWAGF